MAISLYKMADPWSNIDASENAKPSGGLEWQNTTYQPRNQRGSRPHVVRSRGGRGGQGGRGGRSRGGRDSQPAARQEHREEQKQPVEESKVPRGRGGRGDRTRGRPRKFKQDRVVKVKDSGEKKYNPTHVTIRRRRFINNQHQQEVIFADADRQIDLDAIQSDTHLRALEEWTDLPITEDILAGINNAGYLYPSKI